MLLLLLEPIVGASVLGCAIVVEIVESFRQLGMFFLCLSSQLKPVLVGCVEWKF